VRRVIVGSYDPRGSGLEREDLERARDDGARGRSIRLASVSVAWSGQDPPACEPFCLLDGEIYDLEELAADLGLAAATPAERVLSAAYRRQGETMLERLRGDFALVIWDPAARRGLVARDQTSGRAVYFDEQGGTLRFASEVRHLLSLRRRRPAPDPVALAHWLNISGMPGMRTLYEGIRRLPSGHFLRLDRGRWEIRRYWRPGRDAPLRASREELAELLRGELARSVARGLGASGTAGLLVSGGLDSTSVAAIATRLVDPELRPRVSYSAVFPEHPSADESALIDQLTTHLGLASVRIAVRRGSLFPATLEYLRAWELPPTSPNLFFWGPLFRRAVDDGITALVDGEGGDQVFGLSPYLLADRLRRGRILSALQLARTMPGAGPKPPWRSMRRVMVNFGLKGALPVHLQRLRRRLSDPGRYAFAWLTPEMARTFASTDESWRWREARGPRWWNYQVTETTSGLGPTLTLDHVRRRNDLAGVASRHPLLDVDLLELMLRLPPELAYDWRFTRPLFREATAGLVPDAIRLRPDKSSFDAVFHEALLGHDFPLVRRLLTAPDAEIGAYVDQAELRRGLLDLDPASYPGGVVWWALPVWRLTTAELFLRAQQGRGAVERLFEREGLCEPDYELTGLAA
jgi:asparagine synthase (glutamine-hydrolysing)